MKIVFMGTPEFAVPSLEALVAVGHQVVGVFSQPDKPKNRGMKLQPTPVKLCAMVHDLPVYQPTKLRDGTALETIRSRTSFWCRTSLCTCTCCSTCLLIHLCEQFLSTFRKLLFTSFNLSNLSVCNIVHIYFFKNIFQ